MPFEDRSFSHSFSFSLFVSNMLLCQIEYDLFGPGKKFDISLTQSECWKNWRLVRTHRETEIHHIHTIVCYGERVCVLCNIPVCVSFCHYSFEINLTPLSSVVLLFICRSIFPSLLKRAICTVSFPCAIDFYHFSLSQYIQYEHIQLNTNLQKKLLQCEWAVCYKLKKERRKQKNQQKIKMTCQHLHQWKFAPPPTSSPSARRERARMRVRKMTLLILRRFID